MVANMVFGLFIAKVLDDLKTSRKEGKILMEIRYRNDIKVIELEIKKRKKKIQK